MKVLGTFHEILSSKLLTSETVKQATAPEFRTIAESTSQEPVEGTESRGRPSGRSAESQGSVTRGDLENMVNMETSFVKLLKVSTSL